jgi:hypothetical protein
MFEPKIGLTNISPLFVLEVITMATVTILFGACGAVVLKPPAEVEEA